MNRSIQKAANCTIRYNGWREILLLLTKLLWTTIVDHASLLSYDKAMISFIVQCVVIFLSTNRQMKELNARMVLTATGQS